jgi:hypothetical protein
VNEPIFSSAFGSYGSILGLISFEISDVGLLSNPTRYFRAFLMKSCWRVFDRYSWWMRLASASPDLT